MVYNCDVLMIKTQNLVTSYSESMVHGLVFNSTRMMQKIITYFCPWRMLSFSMVFAIEKLQACC